MVATSQQRPPAALKGPCEEEERKKKGIKKRLQELATKGPGLHVIRLCQTCMTAFNQNTVGMFI